MSWLQKIADKVLFNNYQRQERKATDPFNYALHLLLDFVALPDSEKLAHIHNTFPSISKDEAEALLPQARRINRQTIALFYEVRDGKLSHTQAAARLRVDYPQVDEQNLQALCVSGQVAVSK